MIIGAGGFIGAVARFSLSDLVRRLTDAPSPIGTLVVNLLGCLVMGVLMGAIETRQTLSANAQLFWTIGLLGSFTTFSTFSNETYELLRSGQALPAMVNIAISVVLGLAAVFMGRALLIRLLG